MIYGQTNSSLIKLMTYWYFLLKLIVFNWCYKPLDIQKDHCCLAITTQEREKPLTNYLMSPWDCSKVPRLAS